MNKQIVIEYLEGLEKAAYNIKLDLYNNKVDQAYIKLLGINEFMAKLLYRLANDSSEIIK